MQKKIGNHLQFEKSPYLLQHATNPVNWYPWGEEAFQKARIEQKPIFLSIGYSTCHWCHVMEHESFIDKEVSDLLNQSFISIKVDREEQPDVDRVYMSVCEAMTGHGGWPLTLFLNPDLRPFYAGTYYTKSQLLSLLSVTVEKWKTERSDVMEAANYITQQLQTLMAPSSSISSLDPGILDQTYWSFKHGFDYEYGGFGSAPKFPSPHTLLFLLRYSEYKKEPGALKMVETTLQQLYKGGIFDHLGYGFSRYSVDRKWLIPHFEKMLYDNAWLAMVYTETYLATKNPLYREIAEKILMYVQRDMTSAEGGFYTAEDADSEGEEGKFYLWTSKEIQKILNKEDAETALYYYGVREEGNFEGKNVLNLLHHTPICCDTEQIKKIRDQLFLARSKRIHPAKDDKIITSLNGMMIASFAYAGNILQNPSYLKSAQKAADFVLEHLMNEQHHLFTRYRDGEVKHPGTLEDYSYLIYGLTELFLATGIERYYSAALSLNEVLIQRFHDEVEGGYFQKDKNDSSLILTLKDSHDGAIPSGNAIVAWNFLRFSDISDDPDFSPLFRNQLTTFSGMISDNPTSHTSWLIALMGHLQVRSKIIVIGEMEGHETQEVKQLLHQAYHPFTTTVFLPKNLLTKSDFFAHYDEFDGPIAFHLCKNYACEQPLYHMGDIRNALRDFQ